MIPSKTGLEQSTVYLVETFLAEEAAFFPILSEQTEDEHTPSKSQDNFLHRGEYSQSADDLGVPTKAM